MTILNRKRNFLFLHAHKTAGTSIEAHLVLSTPLGDDLYNGGGDFSKLGIKPAARKRINDKTELHNHATAKKMFHIVGQAWWESSVRVSGVRNPYENLVAFWRWDCSGQAGRKDPMTLSFSEWFEVSMRADPQECRERKIIRAPHLQKEFLYIDGELAVTDIIRFEDLAGGLASLADKTGVDIPPLEIHAKFSKKVDYRQFFSDEDAEQAIEFYKSFEKDFGYSF